MQSVVFAFFLCHGLLGQSISEAHKVIDSLSAPSFWGRGYVCDGHTKAADFIAKRFAKLGLEKLQDSYLQYFDFQVNVFDQNVSVKSKRKLVPGLDFLPSADCPSFKGTLRVKGYDSMATYTDKDIVVLNKRVKRFPASSITLSGKKLTHTFAQHQDAKFKMVLLDTAQRKLGKKLKIDIKSNLQSVHSQNVLGYVRGTVAPDTFLVVCAHYDHLGGLGKQCYFPGANDNASGIAMLLQLAEYYTQKVNAPHYSMLFIAFGAEEVGLIGSKYYVEHPLVPLATTKFVLNLDLMGSGLEGITVVNGSIYAKEFEHLTSVNASGNYVKVVKPRGKAANSDHYYFSEHGVKSFFIYSLGEITAYHDINDTASNIPLTKFVEMHHLIVDFLKGL